MGHTDGLTGRLFEEKVIGRCRASWTGVHMKWQAAVDEARKSQPPLRTPTAAKLVALVSKEIGEPVRFCTAVGSCADILHGIDGFFVIEERGIIVTIDLTVNSNKDACKADLLVGPDDVRNLPALAARVVGALKTKMRRRIAA